MPNELGGFLRARRADTGLEPLTHSSANRRRVAGLRREEVAAASGISVDYYTRLEQGREAHPSDAVLDAIARVLRLSVDATEHLYRLRSSAPSAPSSRGARGDDLELAQRLAALVEAVRPNPAYALDRLSNMVAANSEGLALYDGFALLPPGERNTCRYLMTDNRAREIFVEWEEIARGAVAHLRAANAENLLDADLQTLVSELRERSTLFNRWWDEHLVERRRASIKHLRAQDGGITAHRYEVLHLPDEKVRVTIWLPETSRIAEPGE
ncbi:helix-turn-helix domain-containing protein [Microterricola viridarii]|uniref:Transcriptional regulator, contains XRE-family HTH domain n=1 Tax=Microterricola viridarii TaxID=412690 RepID=A0A1H1Q8P3_9MICO|nr:helix-turn-helix transcriptional regulator [Microterricola viridarii]SDS19754.1 Transcriptional regulator, contains XRE-family HTH domain [Microterricola viridarii]